MFTTAAQKLEFAHLDNLFLLRGARPVSSDVVVVALDEVSYLNLQVPMAGAWPRDLHTKLLERLKVMGAKRVVFDILFVSGQSDRSSDERLAQSMRLIPTVIGAAIGTVQQATLNGTYTVEQMIRPDPIFQAAAAGIGMVTLPEVAGRVRSFYQHRSDVFTPLPSLAVAGAGVESSDGIPREGDLINFYGTSADLRRFSYADVVADENRIPSLAFKDKIVVIGLSLRSRNGPAQRDTFSSPFEPEMFGTDIHATAISNVLNKEWITRLSLGSDLVVFVFVATLLALLVSSLPVTLLLPVVIGCVAILAGAQFSLFLVGLFVPLVCSVVSGVVAGLIVRGGAAASTKSRVGRWI
jgi:CHASE2 domain-containing sensor protein